MVKKVRSIDLLPEVFKTPANTQFLRSTLDQLTQQQNISPLNGFIGSKYGYGIGTGDAYIPEISDVRNNYQLEPSIVTLNSQNNKVVDFITYPEVLDSLKNKGADITNQNAIFDAESYSWDSFIDLDKLINFSQYYWLPNGPDSIQLNTGGTTFAPFEVATHILDQKSYTDLSGVKLTSGMLVSFGPNVIPSKYAADSYYVSSVGESIKLTPASELVAVEQYTTSSYLPFDSVNYDETAYDSIANVANSRDYITISRASQDRNAWSRSNRWFHVDVLNTVISVNNSSTALAALNNPNARAARPIIEFCPGLALFNSGINGIAPVDYLDSKVTDINDVIGLSLYKDDANGVELSEGMTIIFSNDPLNANKVYRVGFTGLVNSLVISLTQVGGAITPGVMVTAARGKYTAGKSYTFDGSTYVLSQTKTTVNQPPLFDIFDSSGNSVGDQAMYPSSTFTGSTLFRYTEGRGSDDSVLGFPIKYTATSDMGDISFDVSYNSDSFTYLTNGTLTSSTVNAHMVHQYEDDVLTVKNGWVKSIPGSVQYQVLTFDITSGDTNEIVCDIPVKVAAKQQPIQIYVNNSRLTEGMYSYSVTDTTTILTLADSVTDGDTVVCMIISDKVSTRGFYQIPPTLQNNPLNDDVTVLSMGDIRSHYHDIFKNNPAYTGNPVGPNNFRDVGDSSKYGTKIVKHSESFVLPGLFLKNSSPSILDSLAFSASEYEKYKQELVTLIDNTDYDSYYATKTMLDEAVETISATRDESGAFFWTDMMPTGDPEYSNTYIVSNNNIFPTILQHTSDLSYNGILVYLLKSGQVNPVQLVRDEDYSVSNISSTLTIIHPVSTGDQIIVDEYNKTYGSYVPSTPTSLGFLPAYTPEVVTSDAYTSPTTFIRGHDGSLTKIYGDYVDGMLTDNRDRVLFDFELRIFNNLKVDAPLFTSAELVPGNFRTTNVSYESYMKMHSTGFMNWVGKNRIDYRTQYFSKSDAKTWNYNLSSIKLDDSSGNPVQAQQGNWRGLYMWLYDTTEPATKPWELLGITVKPTWWESRYGVAPYTESNPMWSHLEIGLNWNNGNSITVPGRARPGLSKIIPVDALGNAKSPFDAVIGDHDSFTFNRDWKVGDMSPAEFSYIRSSTYLFDLLSTAVLTHPGKFFNKGVDTNNFVVETELDQHLLNGKALTLGNIAVYGDGELKHSYLNWLVDFENQFGVSGKTKIQSILDNVDVRLAYRLAGFSDPALVDFYVENSRPTSTSTSLLIPDESYQFVLHTNEPDSRISYSSVIVQKTKTGYKVWGNSQTRAYFTYNKPLVNGEYTRLSSGTVSVEIPKHTTKNVEDVAYGTEFTSVQSLVTFLIGYEANLVSTGMVFDSTLNGTELNWYHMVNELLYWVQTGWSVGSIISLNPVAYELKIRTENTVVQPLTIKDKNFALNQDSLPINVNDMSIQRFGTEFIAKPMRTGDAISYFTADNSNIEHGVVFDNNTIFNDTIYNPVTGLRQARLVVKGSKTAEWDGTLDAQGYILNQDNIEDWAPNTKYINGTIIKYKNSYWTSATVIQPSSTFDEASWTKTDYSSIQTGLLPNASTRALESTNFYDSTRISHVGDSDVLGHSLVGYRMRDYMSSTNMTDTSQFKVFKTLITSKGTVEGTKMFNGVDLQHGTIDYDVYENWAIKTTDFGGVLNGNFVEVQLDEKKLTGNPGILKFTDGYITGASHQDVPMYALYNYNRPPTDVNFLPALKQSQPNKLPTAGFVKIDDVKMMAYNFHRLSNAIDSVGKVVPISRLYKGDCIWLADHKGTWDVMSPARMTASDNASALSVVSVVNNLNGTVTVIFDSSHSYKADDEFAILNFDSSVDGYYSVESILDSLSVVVKLSLADSVRTITGFGLVVKMQSHRIKTNSDLESIDIDSMQFTDTKLWIDEDNSWSVYNKDSKYTPVFSSIDTHNHHAVCVLPGLGFLYSDTTVGKMYWVLGDETERYSSYGEYTGPVGFGKTINYANNSVIVSTGGVNGNLYVYDLITAPGATLLHRQATVSGPAGNTWGNSVTVSGDGKWVYVSNNSSIDVVTRNAHDTRTITSVIVSSPINVSRDMYVAGNVMSTLVTGMTISFSSENDAPKYVIAQMALHGTNTHIVLDTEVETMPAGSILFVVTTEYSIVGTIALPGTSTDNAVISMSTNIDGSVLAVGTPNAVVSGSQGVGKVYVYNRIVEHMTVSHGSTGYSDYYVSWTPSGISQVSLNSSPLALDDEYNTIGDRTVIKVPVITGDIITVDSTDYALTQTIILDSTQTEVDINFGTSVAVNRDGTEVLVGAPYTKKATANSEGAVYRFTNKSKKYGVFAGESFTASATAYNVLVNGINVPIPAGNLTTVINSLNAVLRNIHASEVNGKLVLQVVDQSLARVGDKLSIVSVNPSDLVKLGVHNAYTATQVLTPESGDASKWGTGRTSFGHQIKFDGTTFIVAAPDSVRRSLTTFDFTDDGLLDNDTLFDNNFTNFIESSDSHGAVYMYDYLSTGTETYADIGRYVFSQYINDVNVDNINTGYGGAIDILDGMVAVAQHRGTQASRVVAFKNYTGGNNWSQLRTKGTTIDVARIRDIQLYDRDTKELLISLDYIDPLQGKLLGVVHDNLDYISGVDPASYNTSGSNIAWGKSSVGKLWLNTSDMRYLDTHQADHDYNSKHWGKLFPGSVVSVMSWVQSYVTPSYYSGSGTVFSYSDYTTAYDVDGTGAYTPVYYFWVIGTGVINSGKTLSDSVIAEYVVDPQQSGISYMSGLSQHAIGLHNVDYHLNDDSTILHIGIDSGNSVDTSHTAVKLIRENYADDFLPGLPTVSTAYTEPQGLYKKLIHSFAGIDELGAVVPDPELPSALRVGMLSRPRQNLFVDRYAALKVYLTFYNEWLLTFPYAENGLLKTLMLTGDNYDTTQYWSYANWWADGYSDKTKKALTVHYYNDLSALTPYNGMVAAVATIPGSTETYVYESGAWTRIGLQNGTIQFSDSLWNNDVGFDSGPYGNIYDSTPNVEITNIIRALHEEVTADYPLQRNQALILLFNYIQSEHAGEFDNIHWLSKTSLVDIDHTIRELSNTPNYSKDSQDFLTGYINEVKPYHVVIKDFKFKYKITDLVSVNMTDFDLPSKFSIDANNYVSPILVNSDADNTYSFTTESDVWTDPEYTNWFKNYGLSCSTDNIHEAGVLQSYIDATTTSVIRVSNIHSIPNVGTMYINGEMFTYEITNYVLNEVTVNSRDAYEIHTPGAVVSVLYPAVSVMNSAAGYTTTPTITVVDMGDIPARRPMKLSPIMYADKLIGIKVDDIGDGYTQQPEISISHSKRFMLTTAMYNSTTKSLTSTTLSTLQTGQLVRFMPNIANTSLEYYYVGAHNGAITLHTSVEAAVLNRSPIDITIVSNSALDITARAVANMTAAPVREIKTVAKYDRTSYNPQFGHWTPGEYYAGALHAPTYGLASSATRLYQTASITGLSPIGGSGYSLRISVNMPLSGELVLPQIGSLSVTSGSNVVSGILTNFNALRAGQSLVTPTGRIIGTIGSINSATSLTLTSTASNTEVVDSYEVHQGEYIVTIRSAGYGYVSGDVVTIPGSQLNSGSSVNTLTLTINSVGTSGEVLSFTAVGVPRTDNLKIKLASMASTSESILDIQTVYIDTSVRLVVGYSNSSFTPAQLNGMTAILYTKPVSFLDTPITSVRADVIGSGATFDVMTPKFTASRVTPSYYVILSNPGSGYRTDDLIHIDGASLGGISGIHDLSIHVTVVGSSGDIAMFNVIGVASSNTTPVFLKTVTDNIVELYMDEKLTVPVSTSGFSYAVGDSIYLPYQANVDASIVRYAGNVYECINSNNDSEFDPANWEIMDPSDYRINALDRIGAYNNPNIGLMTGININYGTKVITVSTDHSVDDINAWEAYQLEQPVNLGQEDIFNVAGTEVDVTSPWDLVLQSGVTLYPTGAESVSQDISTIIGGIRYPYGIIRDSIFTPEETIASIRRDSSFTVSAVDQTIIDNDFTFGYGPEELVPGLCSDTISITVSTTERLDETIDDVTPLVSVHNIIAPLGAYNVSDIDLTAIPVRVTTDVPHLMSTGDVVMFTGINGAIQLNLNKFEVKVVDATTIELGYPRPAAVIDFEPVTAEHIEPYTSGGVVFSVHAYTFGVGVRFGEGFYSYDADFMNERSTVTATVNGTPVDAFISLIDLRVVIEEAYAPGSEIEITVTNTLVIADPYTFRLNINKDGKQTVERVPNVRLTALASPLLMGDTVINLVNAAAFVDGNQLLIDGEKIYYSVVDLATNTLSGLWRGINGTGQHDMHDLGTTVAAISPQDHLPDFYIDRDWSGHHDIVYGDSLQLSNTAPALFLTKNPS